MAIANKDEIAQCGGACASSQLAASPLTGSFQRTGGLVPEYEE